MVDDIDGNKPAPPPPEMMPICPYCHTDPAMLSARGPIMLGALKLIIVFCGTPTCRKIWNVEIAGVEQPNIVKPVFSLQ